MGTASRAQYGETFPELPVTVTTGFNPTTTRLFSIVSIASEKSQKISKRSARLRLPSQVMLEPRLTRNYGCEQMQRSLLPQTGSGPVKQETKQSSEVKKEMYKKMYTTIVILAAVTASVFSQTGTPDIHYATQSGTPEAKKPGVIRIGVSSPLAEMGKDFNFADTPMAVRNTLEVALKEETTEVVFLESALPEKEARLKKCDFIFFSKVTRKKGGGGFGGLGGLGMLAGAAGMIPGAGGIAGAVAATAASTAISVASMSGGFKSKDEVAFEYRVLAADGSTIIPATASKIKAKKNGEDVLTPQIAAAAEATLAKLVKP